MLQLLLHPCGAAPGLSWLLPAVFWDTWGARGLTPRRGSWASEGTPRQPPRVTLPAHGVGILPPPLPVPAAIPLHLRAPYREKHQSQEGAGNKPGPTQPHPWNSRSWKSQLRWCHGHVVTVRGEDILGLSRPPRKEAWPLLLGWRLQS